jgi:uroporphyrinogen-III synthase
MPGLLNKTLAITRSREQAREFFQLVKADGGRALAIPAIEIVPADRKAAQKFISLLRKKNHDYCAFMSAQAVRVLFDLAGDTAGSLKDVSVIAVGPKTMQELERHGVKVDMMPSKFSSVGLVEHLSENDVKGKRIIIPRSGEANDFAAKALSGLGMKVDEVFLYRTRTARVTSEWEEFGSLLAQNKVDAVVFTSASNVRSFFEIMKKMRAKMPTGTKIISIGPFTTAELAKRKIRCYEAGDHTIMGTVKVARKLLMVKA